MSVPRPMLLLFLFLFGRLAGAQEEVNLFLDAVDVNVVNVEVMVTDSDGEPVHGLTAADFELYEDGRRSSSPPAPGRRRWRRWRSRRPGRDRRRGSRPGASGW